MFIRFCEDNGLLAGAARDGRSVAQPWIAGPGDGLERAVENEAAFYAAAPTMTSRDWLQQAFGTLAELPAGAPLVDRNHSAVWHAEISATAADGLRDFFRRTTPGGELVHDFSDPQLGTRFLGDLYQDLSDYAKKTFALLQTPDFVEEFILDLTLTPAIEEFGLTGLKVIDPTFMRKSNVSRDTRSMRSTTRSLSRRFARIRAPFPDLSTSGACRCRHTSSRRRASRTLPA